MLWYKTETGGERSVEEEEKKRRLSQTNVMGGGRPR